MSGIEAAWRTSLTRRRALANIAGFLAGSPLLKLAAADQIDPRSMLTHKRALGIDEMVTAFDFEPLFFANVPQSVYDYTAHGDGSEWNLRRNREAFDWVDIIPKPGVEPSAVNLSGELFGIKQPYPIWIAPSATQVPLHPTGEIGMRQGGLAAAATPMIVSQNTSTPIEKIGAATTSGTLWWQLYPSQNFGTSKEIIDRAQESGCTAVVVTVDQQASYYERTQHGLNLGGNPRVPGGRGRGGGGGRAGGAAGRAGGAGGAAPAAPTGAARYGLGGGGRLWYSWNMIDQLRPMVKGQFLIKGIVTAEDARLCVDHGATGIVVSNHGGRSMDYGPSTLEALPEIAAAVNGRIPILIDSGFRRGSDVFKALALGASGVLLGRAARWGLAAFGPPGVQRLLEIVQRELVEAAASAGCTTLASINKSVVRTRFV